MLIEIRYVNPDGTVTYNYAQVRPEDISQLFIPNSVVRANLAREVAEMLLTITESCEQCETQEILITVTDFYPERNDVLTVTWKTDSNSLFVQHGTSDMSQVAQQIMALIYCTFLYELTEGCEELPICKILTVARTPRIPVMESPRRTAYLALYTGTGIPNPSADENVE